MEHAKIRPTAAADLAGESFVFNKVAAVKPLGNYRLEITFERGAIKIYDVEPLFAKWSAFTALRDEPSLFALVKVAPGGYAISWNDAIDLSCSELWDNGAETAPPAQ